MRGARESLQPGQGTIGNRLADLKQRNGNRLAVSKEPYGNRLADLKQAKEGVVLAGIVTQMRVQMTRRGRMAFVTLDDGTAQMEVSVFNEVFEANRAWLKEDTLVIANGKVSEDNFTGGLRVLADALYNLASARNVYARRFHLNTSAQTLSPLGNPITVNNEDGYVPYGNVDGRPRPTVTISKEGNGRFIVAWSAKNNTPAYPDPAIVQQRIRAQFFEASFRSISTRISSADATIRSPDC